MKCDFLKKPVILATVMALAVLIATETVGLLILHHIGIAHPWVVLLDLLLVVIVLLPFIFFFVYRPMVDFCRVNNQLLLEKEQKIEELDKAFREITTLRGILPICATCKKIRDNKGYWNQVEAYISVHREKKSSYPKTTQTKSKFTYKGKRSRQDNAGLVIDL